MRPKTLTLCIVLTAILLLSSGTGNSQPAPHPKLSQHHAIDHALDKSTAVVHTDRIELKIRPGLLDVSRLEVLKQGPQGWAPAAGALTSLPDGSGEIEIQRGEVHLLRSRIKPPQPATLTTDKHRLPGRIIFAPAAGEPGGTEGVVRSWAPFVALAQSPLPWSDEMSLYAGEVITGLEEVHREGAVGPAGIPQPVPLNPPLHVMLTTQSAEVNPRDLQITETGTAGFKRARVTSGSTAGRRSITVWTDVGERTLVFAVGQQLGRIGLKPANTEILGFGLGRTSIAVVREAEDGTPLSDPTPLPVSLQTTRGALEPATAEIAGGNSQTSVHLQSDGTGTAEITAQGGGVTGTVSVEFVAPVLFAIVTVIAGAAGGAVRWWEEGQKGRSPRPKLLTRTAIGVVVGVAVVAGVTTGIVRAGLAVGPARTAAGAGVVALIAGWQGTRLFTAIAKGWGWGTSD